MSLQVIRVQADLGWAGLGSVDASAQAGDRRSKAGSGLLVRVHPGPGRRAAAPRGVLLAIEVA